jgi:hypothetical protein
MLRKWLISFNTRRLATAILFVAIFAMAVRAPADTDTWWHLQAGRVTVESGHILQSDIFSHTRTGEAWVNHSWLSQVVLYKLFDLFSYAGLGLWMGFCVALAFGLVYLQMDGNVFIRAFILILAAATSAVIWVARPQLLSFVMTALVSYIIYLFKWRGVNRLWLLPPIFILWVNLHAGYALGFILMVLFVVGEVANHLLEPFIPADTPVVSWRALAQFVGIALLSAFLLVINPNTTQMWTYYLKTVRINILQDFIQEWQSPDFHPLYTQPFIWLLMATLAAIGLSKKRIDGTDLAVVFGFTYSALLAGRNFGPFALVIAPVLSRHVNYILVQVGWEDWTSPLLSSRLRLLFGMVNLWLLFLICALAAVKISDPIRTSFNERIQRESLPVDAASWIIEQKPEGKMFNHYNWGGYLIWRLWPDYRVFVDGRTDLYGDEILSDYVAIQSASSQTNDLLQKYDISFVLTMRNDSLSRWLRCQNGWRLVHQDEIATIWLKDTRY